MSTHPYQDLSDSHFWSRSVAAPGAHDIDPVVAAGFSISPTDKVATLGSCFAQHLSRFLKRSGLTYYVAENGPKDKTKDELKQLGYGVYSARYGNVYTVRQAVQLFDRAYGLMTPSEPVWRLGDRWVDPFRPRVEPDGFESLADLLTDRESHFAAVRAVFERSAVLVFTLGLTEAWQSILDESVFPVVPGAAGGTWDPNKYEFVNFTASQVTADLFTFADRVRGVNPDVQILLTVSPVPLIASYSDDHVLAATTYSKSVLRVAAQEVSNARDFVHYFPSYEIITGIPSGNRYFAPDLREVTEEGVAHVMRVFDAHYLNDGPTLRSDADGTFDDLEVEFREASSVVCDEEVLDAPGDR